MDEILKSYYIVGNSFYSDVYRSYSYNRIIQVFYARIYIRSHDNSSIFSLCLTIPHCQCIFCFLTATILKLYHFLFTEKSSLFLLICINKSTLYLYMSYVSSKNESYNWPRLTFTCFYLNWKNNHYMPNICGDMRKI